MLILRHRGRIQSLTGRGCDTVTDKEKRDLVQKLGKAVENLPKAERNYLLGFADGILASRKEKGDDRIC